MWQAAGGDSANAHMDAFSQQLQNELKDAIDKKEPGLPLYYGDVEMLVLNTASIILCVLLLCFN